MIDGVVKNLKEHYVDREVAQKMSDALLAHEKVRGRRIKRLAQGFEFIRRPPIITGGGKRQGVVSTQSQRSECNSQRQPTLPDWSAQNWRVPSAFPLHGIP